MSKTIRLDEAIRKRIVNEGDLINPSGLYTTKSQRVFLKQEDTGTFGVKSYDREKNLKCFYCENSYGIPTLWFDNLSNKLCLTGEKGFLNGVSALNKVCNLFSNIELGLIATSVTREDILHLSKMEQSNKRLQSFKGRCWLATRNITTQGNKHYFGLEICIKNESMNGYLYCVEDKYEYSDCIGIRPEVSIFLPSNILVCMESYEQNGGWRLIPNKEMLK